MQAGLSPGFRCSRARGTAPDASLNCASGVVPLPVCLRLKFNRAGSDWRRCAEELMARFVTKLSQILDRIAGWVLVATMVLVVGNIILRLFKRPIEGTYEWVGFLTTLVTGLAVAYCAVHNGHIAITFLTERLSSRTQAVIDFVIGLISLGFLILVSWQLAGYATTMIGSGEVALTTRVPFYPFIYLAAFGFLIYCLVVLVNLGEAVRKVVRK